MTPLTQKAADASTNDLSKSRRGTKRRAAASLRGSTGPTTQRGKQKSSYNALKHGIFAVGLVRDRESRAQYHGIVAGMVETLQPAGRLEEILVEKLAMLVWRYRRLLEAEAAEVEKEADSAGQGNLEGKARAMLLLKGEMGLIPGALLTKNEMALQASIETLKELRQRVQEKGLNWERDREAFKELYGVAKEQGKELRVRVVYDDDEENHMDPDPASPLVSSYRELLAGAGKDQQSATDVPRDAAGLMVSMLGEKIANFNLMLSRWIIRNEASNRLQAATTLVPKQEVIDRLQRYEASLDRSFDRTLSQLERLQRLRLGQSVLPAIKVDVSH